MRDLVIIGAGGFAREVAFLVEDINRSAPTWRLLGFIDADRARVGAMVGGYSVVGVEPDLERMEVAAVIGIGTPRVVRHIVDALASRPNLTFPNLVHPGTVWDQGRVALGQGNIVCAGNIFTTDIRVGSFNIFNLNSTWGHDVVVGSCCVFNPGLNISGSVTIGDDTLVGTGATILQGLSVGAGATIGAGAVVTKDVEAGTTVVGVPAKPLSR
jgi:sugar O-acyltransferase (sialic acid O-acetyltransferase NeuD family)